MANLRTAQAKRYGKLGGLATAGKHGSEFCQARAEKAGLACKAKYGSDYYEHIQSRRKRITGKVAFRETKAFRKAIQKVVGNDPLIANLMKIALQGVRSKNSDNSPSKATSASPNMQPGNDASPTQKG